MEQPTQWQIETFWKRIGFILKEDDRTWTEWRDSNDELVCCGHIGANPPIDLNHLFKYAVPKARVALDKNPLDTKLYKLLISWAGEIEDGKKDPAISLFWDIWEVIK